MDFFRELGLLNRVRRTVGDHDRNRGGVMMNQQPSVVCSHEKIGGRGKRRVKAGFVEHRYVLGARNPRKVSVGLNPNIRRARAELLSAFEYHFPALANAIPSG